MDIQFSHKTACTYSLPDILPQSSGVDGGTVAGAVIGTLAVLVLVAITVVIAFVLYHKICNDEIRHTTIVRCTVHAVYLTWRALRFPLLFSRAESNAPSVENTALHDI